MVRVKDLAWEPSHLIGHQMDIVFVFLERQLTFPENSRNDFSTSWPPVRFANPPFVKQAVGFFF